MSYTKQPTIARFLNHIEIAQSHCWEWTAGVDQKGYGLFWFDGRMVRAHRFSFEWFNERLIPKDRQIDHLCRNHRCVNPDHLEVVTLAENIARGLTGIHNRQKTECAHGHPYIDGNIYYEFSNGKPRRHCKICVMNDSKRRRLIRKGMAQHASH